MESYFLRILLLLLWIVTKLWFLREKAMLSCGEGSKAGGEDKIDNRASFLTPFV
jgi:hypothetical protein